MTTVPDPVVVMQDLEPFFLLLHPALEYGTFKARVYFEGDGLPIDRSFAPHFVRYWTKQELNKHGQNVLNEEEVDFELEQVNNNGLFVVFKDYQIRILKSVNHGLPVPGHSRRRQDFYNQQTSFGFNLVSGESSPSKPNLVILWDVDDDYNLKDLILACPKEGGTTRASVKEHWIHPVPLPVLLIKSSLEGQLVQDEVKDSDLPISLDKLTDTGTEDAE